MRVLAAIIVFLAGLALGAYLGLWVFLVGGIVDIIDGAKADPTDGGLIAWGVVKAFILSGLVGGAVIWVSAILAAVIGDKPRPQRRPTAKQTQRNFDRRIGRLR